MVGGEGREFYLSHRPPGVKRMDQAIAMDTKQKPNANPKSSCTYCEWTRYKVADCGDFHRDYLRPQPQQSIQEPLPPRSPAHTPSDQLDEDKPEEERFGGSDMPEGAQGGSTGGAGGRQPPRDGNVAAGDHLGNSSSSSSCSDGSDTSPPDLRHYLDSRKRHWIREKKDKCDRRYAALNKFIHECHTVSQIVTKQGTFHMTNSY